MQYQHLSVTQLEALIQDKKTVNVVDTRDPQSFSLSTIEGAFNLNQNNLEQYISNIEANEPLVVCCYHGHSSQGVARYLSERGFNEVYSLDGGYEAYSAFHK